MVHRQESQALRRDNLLAAASSTSQISFPLLGRTFCDGKPAALFSRISCRIGALSGPLARNVTQAAAFRTGKVKVRRWVLNFGTQLATTRRWVSLSAAVPGKREAVCPSGPSAQEDQIKAWKLAGREVEEIFDRLLVLLGRGGCIFFLGVNPKDIFRRHLDFREQGFVDHAVIAVGMVGRNVTLIAPEKIDLVPRDAGFGRQQRVQSLSASNRRRERR